jgi:hypothetical protein
LFEAVAFDLPDAAGGVTLVCVAVEERLVGIDLMESVGVGTVIGMVDVHHVRFV